jgi:hypothetical protein
MRSTRAAPHYEPDPIEEAGNRRARFECEQSLGPVSQNFGLSFLKTFELTAVPQAPIRTVPKGARLLTQAWQAVKKLYV